MDACEPRPRHRGFFLHSSESGEPDTGEHENPEGFIVRVRFPGHPIPRRMTNARRRISGLRFGGRSRRTDSRVIVEGQQPVVKGWRRTEGDDAPRRQGATTENTGSI